MKVESEGRVELGLSTVIEDDGIQKIYSINNTIKKKENEKLVRVNSSGGRVKEQDENLHKHVPEKSQ